MRKKPAGADKDDRSPKRKRKADQSKRKSEPDTAAKGNTQPDPESSSPIAAKTRARNQRPKLAIEKPTQKDDCETDVEDLSALPDFTTPIE